MCYDKNIYTEKIGYTFSFILIIGQSIKKQKKGR